MAMEDETELRRVNNSDLHDKLPSISSQLKPLDRDEAILARFGKKQRLRVCFPVLRVSIFVV